MVLNDTRYMLAWVLDFVGVGKGKLFLMLFNHAARGRMRSSYGCLARSQEAGRQHAR